MKKIYYLWIPLLMAEDCDKVIALLVREKFGVSNETENGLTETARCWASHMLFLKLEKDCNEEVGKIRNLVNEILKKNGIKHFGIIVLDGTTLAAAWIGTNINITESRQKRKERLRTSNLRLVPNPPPPNDNSEKTDKSEKTEKPE